MVKKPEKKKKEEEKKVKLDKIDIRAALTLSGIKFIEQIKQNAKDSQAGKRKNHTVLEEEEEGEAKKMRLASSKRRNLDTDESGFVHGKNHNASLEKHNVLDDNEEEEDEEVKKMRSKRRNLDGESEIPRARIAGSSNHSGSLKKHNVLDDEEEEIMRSRSKRRHLGGENEVKSRTPQSQIAGRSNPVSEKLPKPRIGYSIDGKRLPKPKFGYSIYGKKLPRNPPIQNLEALIRECSEPFEKKLLKTDVDKISLHRDDVKRAILPLLKKDEIDNLGFGIPVNTYDEFGKCYEMIFEMYRNSFYKLFNGWEKLLKDHELKENEDCYVAVWVFRHVKTGGLCFAVTLKR